MDRRKAYALLTEEMETLTGLRPDEAAAAGRYTIIGRIHDNSPVRFEPLEEHLDFAPAADT